MCSIERWEWEGGTVTPEDYEKTQYVSIHQIAGRANTPRNKDEVMSRLAQLWRENPHMRLIQLIENARGGDRGTLSAASNVFYNIEDFAFITKLEEFYDA